MLQYTIFDNNVVTNVLNDGWAGFFGGYIGAIIGAITTLIAVSIQIKNAEKKE